MNTLRDAPWIERAERTGYAAERYFVACECCGEVATRFTELGHAFCEPCALERAERERTSLVIDLREELAALEALKGDELLEWGDYMEGG